MRRCFATGLFLVTSVSACLSSEPSAPSITDAAHVEAATDAAVLDASASDAVISDAVISDALALDTSVTDVLAPDVVVSDAPSCGPPAECAATWERNAAARLAGITGDTVALRAFLRDVPKGGDLHNHLSGAVYAETYLEWGRADGHCINTTTFAAVARTQCATAGNAPAPSSGPLFERVLRAWSMLDFVPGAESGHDHFFATFGKFGAIAGLHRDDSIADVATRAADENVVYVETMFNLGTNVGSLAASLFSGTVTPAALPDFYTRLLSDARFASQLDRDLAAVTGAATRYRQALDCDGLSTPAACDVKVRFTAQVSRTGGNDQIFGQLVSAFEMASRTPQLVAVNLSSPEDDPASLRNYELHMAMLDFLHARYRASGRSPLHITLHAGEIVPRFLPSGYAMHNTFHIRRAVEVGHAERIGHGLDILSETDPEGLMATMRDRGILVEVCLSSNDQILEVRGSEHPLARYLAAGVPVALATDDQGVSRSSLAGEYERAVRDQRLGYLQLKAMARASLEHAFLPGPSLWASLTTRTPTAACVAPETPVPGDAPSAACRAFLATSERAQAQWELERRFLTFEQQQ